MPADDQWNPKRVGDALIEAVTWARYCGGPVGPSGIRSAMPSYNPTWEDRLTEGWGLPDGPDEEEQAARERNLRRATTPEQVSRHLAALEWPAIYVAKNNPGDARVLALWVKCKVYRRPFNAAVDRRKYLTSSLAYRMRDRALSAISVGLDRDGVPL